MHLLSRTIGIYIAEFEVGLIFGCASFRGADPGVHAVALSYLHDSFLAPEEVRPIALANRSVDMRRVPNQSVDQKAAFAGLPTLIRGYLRLNGKVGLGTVIDRTSNTTDVCIVLDADRIARRYVRRFGKTSGISQHADHGVA